MTQHTCNNCGDDATVHKYDARWCFGCFVDAAVARAGGSRP